MDSFFRLSYFTNFFKVKDVNGFENLQKRITEKKQYLEKIISSFQNIRNYIKDLYDKIENSNKSLSNIVFSVEENNIQEVVKSIYQKLINDLKEKFNLIGQAHSLFSKHISVLSKEITFYEEFKKINKELQEEKERLLKAKENYHKLGQKGENEVKDFAKYINRLNDIYDNLILYDQLENKVEPMKKALYDYKASLSRSNKLIKNYNQQQSLIFNYFPEITGGESAFYYRLIQIYHQSLEKENNDTINEIKKIKNIGNLEEKGKTKIMELIEFAEDNRKEEKIQKLIHYPTELDFNKCKNKNEFELFSNSITIIKNFVNTELFPNYDYEKEKKNYTLFQMIKQLFNEKQNKDEKLYADFLELIKDKDVHKAAFIILSQLRTNGKFVQSKNIIDLLGKAFNILLENAGKNKIYDNVKNCIILSQTYFYEDENKNKIYIFESIKNSKYLKNSQFWRSFINDMIKKEFERFENVFPDSNINIEKNININKKIKEKLNEVVFSQLLTYSSNMKDFEIDKRIILKIVDEFVEKYNYISASNLDCIYEMISSGKEDIEKLRKEYDPSLEDKLIEESNINEEEEKKEIKNNEVDKEEKKEIKNNEVDKEEKKEIKNNEVDKEEKKEMEKNEIEGEDKNEKGKNELDKEDKKNEINKNEMENNIINEEIKENNKIDENEPKKE